jgi:cytoskeletal protein RodZ
MKDKKDKVQVMLILFVVIGALVFSIAGFVGAFRDKSSDTIPPVSDSSASQASSSQSKPESILPPDSQETESEETANSQDSSAPQDSSYEQGLSDNEASDLLATLYGSDMFGAEQPKDLLENEEFMTALQEYGMTEEEIRAAINEMQIAFEESNG